MKVMAFVDTFTMRAAAGRGGDGVVRWLHLKGKEKGGPAGGNGGRGGDIIFRAVRDLNVLSAYKGQNDFKAEHGMPGGNQNMHGAGGKDFIFNVPVGALVTRVKTGETREFLVDGEEVVMLKGGNGGYGNAYFKSATHQNPFDSRPGQSGESDTFKIELRIIADGGLIGLPNAGKSSLLNALTAAHAKVGAYPFTTLEPNLGVLYGYVLADIPGLIEGASEGKGLGQDFLRHISRTKVLLHVVASDAENPHADYVTVRKELEKYGKDLVKKPELIIITKTDMITDAKMKELVALFAPLGAKVLTVTVLDDAAVKHVSDSIVQFLSKSV